MMKLTSKDITKILVEANLFNMDFMPYMMIFDKEFVALPDRVAKQVISKDNTNTVQYVSEIGDCDNFAFELRNAFGRFGYACGVLIIQPDGWDTAHAIFFWINPKKQVRLVEPQTDKPFTERFFIHGVIMY